MILFRVAGAEQDHRSPAGLITMAGSWRQFLQVIGIFLIGISSLTLGGCNISQEEQDRRDQVQIRKLLGIPAEIQLIAFAGYPSRVGFGQREGLDLAATFHFTGQQLQDFLEAPDFEKRWSELPVPEATIVKIKRVTRRTKLNLPTATQQGFYLCETAGDNILYSKSSFPCSSKTEIIDFIFAWIDQEQNTMLVKIKAAY